MPPPISHLFRWIKSVFLPSIITIHGLAKPIPTLKLQAHKVQLAQRLCREGVNQKKPMLVAEGYYEYGKLYTAASDYVSAHRWFLKTLRILEPLGDSYELARLHVRLADLAMLQGQYPETAQHAYTALAIAKRSQSERGMIRSYAVLARVHAHNWFEESPASIPWPKANPDSALYYFRKVESIAYRLNDPMEVAHVKQDIGGQLIGKKDPRAINYMKEALAIATRQNSPDRIHMALSVASAYLHFGYPDRAWPYIQKTQRVVELEYPDVYDWEMAIEQALVEFYRKTGNWQQVALHSDQIHKWEKRDLLADREGAISRLHIDYQTQQKDLLLKAQKRQVQLQAENLRIHQQIIVVTISLLLLALGGAFIFFRLYRKNQRISELNTNLVQEQNHRVKNNLQVVSSLLSLQANRITDDKTLAAIEETRARIQSMVILHRRLYEGDKLVHISLDEFIDEIVDVVLQAYGYSTIEVRYDLQPIDLLADDALAVGLLINELTTNACKYAFHYQTDPAYFVACQQRNQQIHLTVADNGPGFSSAQNLPSQTSFGMTLIRTLVDQLKGSYQFTNQNGTKFTLFFPTQ